MLFSLFRLVLKTEGGIQNVVQLDGLTQKTTVSFRLVLKIEDGIQNVVTVRQPYLVIQKTTVFPLHKLTED